MKQRSELVQILALVLVLLVSAYFRFTGLFWGDYQYQHPDERFLIWVVADIAPVDSLGDYFNTDQSTLNPANRGHGFFVYGTLPVFATRYLVDAFYEFGGWEEILETGRTLSAVADLFTVLLVYLAARRLFDWRVGTLAGLFAGMAVLQIQLAHYFTVDSFATTFTMLAVYYAVRIAPTAAEIYGSHRNYVDDQDDSFANRSGRERLMFSLLFGLAVGLAMACKLNTAPVAVLLPIAIYLDWLHLPKEQRDEKSLFILRDLALGGLVAFLAFRIFQPYAFEGPSFINMMPHEGWLNSIREQRAQAAGDVDFPPSLQWARRSKLFSFQNLTVWGLGLPLGIAAWAGFLWMGYRQFRRLMRRVRMRGWSGIFTRTWPAEIIIWGWTAFYFLWQSSAWNPTMRYQLLIYPTLAIMAAYGIFRLWDAVSDRRRGAAKVFDSQPESHDPWISKAQERRRVSLPRLGAGLLGAAVVLLTFAWAFAFTRIYTRPESRYEASLWIYENAPGPVNLDLQVNGDLTRQLLPVGDGVTVNLYTPYRTVFEVNQQGWITDITLPDFRLMTGDSNPEGGERRFIARVIDLQNGDQEITRGEVIITDANSSGKLVLPFQNPLQVQPGQRYGLSLELLSTSGSDNVQVELFGQVQLEVFTRSQAAAKVEDPSLVLFPGQSLYQLPEDGWLRQVRLLEEGNGTSTPDIQALSVVVRNINTNETRTASAVRAPGSVWPVLRLDAPLEMKAEAIYEVRLDGSFTGVILDPLIPFTLDILSEPVIYGLPYFTRPVRAGQPLSGDFVVDITPEESARLTGITLWRVAQQDYTVDGPVEARLTLFDASNPMEPLVEVHQPVDFPDGSDLRGSELSVLFEAPLELQRDHRYTFKLELEGSGTLTVHGSAPANETDWDMGLPFRAKGYDGYGGYYQRDLNLQMYWPDDEAKLQRFISTLDQADYIFISSNRQWGTTVRVPERYPLTTTYYRHLIGCPPDQEVLQCYTIAGESTYQGELGFDLVKVIEPYPNLGPLKINTQYAEEAFTVYDHPKVFIFKKSGDYNTDKVRELLGGIDLSQVVHISPKKAADYSSLQLTEAEFARQKANGTWAELFPPDSILNSSPAAAVAAWWGLLFLIGWTAYPLLRLAMPGLADRGYPLARIAGLLLLAYLTWLLGSLGVSVTPTLITLVLAFLMAAALVASAIHHESIREELRSNWRYFLGVEGVALAFFLAFLLVRMGNPDLWHVIFGGEKPMDFSYFNAVLKSTTFPPYDPWFAGGQLNYYYFGFVLVGMPVKLLGITPSVAYNLILPAVFSMAALGAFCLGWNLIFAVRPTVHGELGGHRARGWLAGIFAALALMVLGNLGTVRMVWQGWQRMAAGEEIVAAAGFFQKIFLAVAGFGEWVAGAKFHYYPGDWYWIPSRAIMPAQAGEITEFPFFSFLYADPHAHMIALPLTLLALAWALSVVLCAGRWGNHWTRAAWGVAFGALVVAALRPTNAWDQPTYLIMTGLALTYGLLRKVKPSDELVQRLLRTGLHLAAFVGLSVLFFFPFNAEFRAGYNEIKPWLGNHTNLSSYLVHWGLFLFIIAAWLFHEAVDWMASTPVSMLNRLRPYQSWITGGVLLLVGLLGFLIFRGVVIAWLAVPLGVACAVLLFRPGQPEAKRVVLFMVGSGLALTLAVEVIALQGDRMNTVFKFYFQAWTMLALSAAAALVWLLPTLRAWPVGWRRAWNAGLILLVMGVALNPIIAARAKLFDRMEASAPTGLDGMRYMAYTRMYDGPPGGNGAEMDLSEDYHAIRWMQHNVQGSPVIVEAHTQEYRHWGNRFTIYTGLPGIIGWQNHQRQQRALTPGEWISERINQVAQFYQSTDRAEVEEFLQRYDVEYVIVGQLEQIYYPGDGLEKFAALEGDLWEKVYADGATSIYQVID